MKILQQSTENNQSIYICIKKNHTVVFLLLYVFLLCFFQVSFEISHCMKECVFEFQIKEENAFSNSNLFITIVIEQRQN